MGATVGPTRHNNRADDPFARAHGWCTPALGDAVRPGTRGRAASASDAGSCLLSDLIRVDTVGGWGHTDVMFLLAGLSIFWLIIVALVFLAFLVYGAGMFLTPGAPTLFRLVSAFVIANIVVAAGAVLVRQA